MEQRLQGMLQFFGESDVDKANQSYNGETRLHFLRSDGCHEGAVPFKESRRR